MAEATWFEIGLVDPRYSAPRLWWTGRKDAAGRAVDDFTDGGRHRFETRAAAIDVMRTFPDAGIGRLIIMEVSA